MKSKIPNCARVWKQLDDFVVPNLALNAFDRAAYSYLLRHSRLEGQRRLHFSLAWLANGVRVCAATARPVIRRLLERGALRLVERSKAGHLVEVLLPEEIPGAVPESCNGGRGTGSVNHSPNIEELDFFRNVSLRKAIHARERDTCFYCLRRLNPTVQALDHVVAQVRAGGNSYRNLVSCCMECNSRKSQSPAGDFLRWLYREGRLTSRELAARLRALRALAAGKLRPQLSAASNPPPRPGRVKLDPAARRIDDARRQH
jgi:hypothetical protein